MRATLAAQGPAAALGRRTPQLQVPLVARPRFEPASSRILTSGSAPVPADVTIAHLNRRGRPGQTDRPAIAMRLPGLMVGAGGGRTLRAPAWILR